MKYLKFYESCDYQEISMFKYYEHDKNTLTLTEKEVDYIKNFYDKYKSKFKIKIYREKEIIINISDKIFNNSYISIFINKLEDDYFLLRIYIYGNHIHKYYVCDQLTGLKHCIKHINNIYKIY